MINKCMEGRVATSLIAIVIAGMTVTAVPFLGGCSVATQTPSRAQAQAVASQTLTPASNADGTKEDWQAQAIRLAQALQDVEDSIATPAEPAGAVPADGTFAVRILDASPAGFLVVDRQQLYLGDAAYAAAKKAGSSIDHAQYVVNREPERLKIPVAGSSSFVVWYPGEDATNVSPPDFAAMSALSMGEFARLWASDNSKRDALGYWGGWATVADGKLTSFVEVNTP